MNFASRSFFVFLPVVLAVYHLLLRQRGHRYAFLLLASWFFYLSWNPWFLWVLILPTIVDYSAGLLIEGAATPRRRRMWLLASIVTNLGFLASFKYTSFLLNNGLGLASWLGFTLPSWTVQIVLPLGISFHTFQGISYTLDVYQGRIRAVRSFIDFALFVAFFPQLVAGPIVRAVEFLPQMETPPRVTARQVVEGIHWFLIGIVKKLFIADRLAQFVDPVFAAPGSFDALTLRWAVVAYACQIYCDFSGYSDLAIATAKWFGFELPLNFDYPYLSASIADFWKRWHVSLSTWIRDYVYFPLGGSRVGAFRLNVNLVLTMTLCGLWHGASWNYVLWGFYNGVLLALHRLYDRGLRGVGWADRLRGSLPYRAAAVVATFVLVACGLILVRSESWAGCWLVQRAWLGGATAGTAWLPAWVPLLAALVALEHAFSGLRGKRCGILELAAPLRAACYTAAVALLVVFAPGAGRAFIYFQF
jgi:alginate O-acetyltransferase complex protein AlgI